MYQLVGITDEIKCAHNARWKSKVLCKIDKILSAQGIGCSVIFKYLTAIRSFIASDDGLIADADVLLNFAKKIEKSIYGGVADVTFFADVNKKLRNVFDYEAFAKYAQNTWCAADLIREIVSKNRVCPYCGADLIYAIQVNAAKGRRTYRSSFDHFFPRSRYPFLGLSLYNLMPSCFRCNSQLKRDDYQAAFRLKNPYTNVEFDKIATFLPLIKNVRVFANGASKGDIDVKFLATSSASNEQREVIRMWGEEFAICDIYTQLHWQLAADTIVRCSQFNDSYVDEMAAVLKSAGFQSVDTSLLRKCLIGKDNPKFDICGKMLEDFRRLFSINRKS